MSLLMSPYRFAPDTWTANNSTLSPLNGDLVAYWKAEDLTDEINSHTLTNAGSATFTAGKYDDAFTLNGSSQYFSALSSADWQMGSDDFTISMWVKWTSFPGAGVNDVLIGQASQSASGQNRWILYAGGTGGIAVYASDTGELVNFTQGSSAGWSSETWYLVTLTRVGNDWKIYRNDTVVASTTDSSALPTLTRPLWIGAQDEASPSSHVGGQIDEVGIWKGHGMSLAEVQALYNSGTGAFLV